LRQIRSAHKPGTVGYIQANRPRFQGFFDSIERLCVPGGTALSRAANYNAAHNRNELITGIEGDWIFFLDDDHVFEEDCLLRLLDCNVDIVSALYCRRYPPFDPVVYRKADPEKRIFELWSWEGLSEESGVLEIAACGAGGLLVRRKVFEAMKSPWFKVGGSSWDTDIIGEDTNFCVAARELGFKVYVNLDVQFAHMPDEALLIPLRQPNGAFNVAGKIGEHTLWMLPEQKKESLIRLA
jgi:Glycosyl transferase family 2